MTITVEHTHVFAALMEDYFSGPTSNEYEEIQSCVHEIFTAPQPIFLSDLPSPLSGAL